ncbi:MAG: hypothetical protein JWO08_3740 [Verrucomicrobiaceae bacterium]|nr:hypothetical protein [Verrucomicrobiaceae bacterium]
MKATLFAALALTLVTVFPAAAQQAADRKTGPEPKDVDGNEVQKPTPVKEQDSRVLHSLNAMPIEKLEELLLVYEKLDNTGMMDALVRTILRRDPKNAEALRVRDDIDPKEVTRDAGYLQALSKKVLAGQAVEDVDGIGLHAGSLLEGGHAEQGVALLEALRKNQFKDKAFPFLDDLAFGYAEMGRLDQSEAAYKAVIADPTFSSESRSEAERALAGLGTKKRIANIRRANGGDPEEIAKASARLYAEAPGDEDVTSFRIEALTQARHYDETISMLLGMRAKYHGQGTWPYLDDLAYAYYASKRYDRAVATFREIQQAPDLDASSKIEAENMILEIQVGRLIESGTSALDKGHYAEAKAILQQLERDYHTHDDVLGYKAMYLAKTGKSQEALELLYARKRKADKEHVLFTQQDVIADVYLERKEYGLARSATLAIVNDTRYDEQTRRDAHAKILDIRVAELLDQGDKALQDGNRSRALSILRESELIAPDRIEIRVFDAEVALAYNQNTYARDSLTQLKAQDTDGVFVGQISLASALAETGRWEEAYGAYSQVLHNPGYDLDDQWEARFDRRELLALFRPTLRSESHYDHSSEGSVFSNETKFSSRWYGDWRFTAFTRSDFTKLDRTNTFGNRSDTRYEGGITATRRFDNGYFAEATLGGSKDNVLYGARIGKTALQSLGWSLGFEGNGRATDSTTLQALNGRENRVEFKVAGPIAERVMLDLDSYYQWVNVGGSKIGHGYGVEASLDYVVQTETRSRPEILFGYHGEYRKFQAGGALPRAIRDQVRRAEVPETQVRRALGSSEEVRRAVAGDFGREVFDDLIDPETNRQGVEIKLRKHLSEKWTAFAQFGTYYAFDDKMAGWDASVGLEYWINDSTMLFGELRYDSDGRGASSGSGFWEANVGGSMSF